MSAYVNFVLGLLSVIAIGCVIYFIVLKISKKDEMKNTEILINLDTKHARHALGLINSDEVGTGGRHKVSFLPTDIKPELFDFNKDEEIVYDKNSLHSFPKNSWSPDRNIFIGLPNKSEDLPDAVRDSFLGKLFGLGIELQQAANAEVRMLREGSDRRDASMKELGDLQIPNKVLEMNKELIELAIKNATSGKEVKSNFGTPSSLNQGHGVKHE